MQTDIRELTIDELDQASGGQTNQQVMKVYHEATRYTGADFTKDMVYALVNAEVAGGCCN
jgi:hypothetical protein